MSMLKDGGNLIKKSQKYSFWLEEQICRYSGEYKEKGNIIF